MGLRLRDKNQLRAVQGTGIATCTFLKTKPAKKYTMVLVGWNFIASAIKRDGKRELRGLIVWPNGLGFFNESGEL